MAPSIRTDCRIKRSINVLQTLIELMKPQETLGHKGNETLGRDSTTFSFLKKQPRICLAITRQGIKKGAKAARLVILKIRKLILTKPPLLIERTIYDNTFNSLQGGEPWGQVTLHGSFYVGCNLPNAKTKGLNTREVAAQC